ncbi:MAG: NAD-dependent epimerase/dehydratase family protein [bacterium]|nr:NAD-dependent epimerase/dehydratase family protein [bacterium]
MADPAPISVAVAGACGPLGRRVSRRLVDHSQVGTVVGFDLRPNPGIAGLEYVSGDVTELDLETLLADVDVLVHLVSAVEPWSDEEPAGTRDAEVTRLLLEAASAAGVGRLVLMSTAMVYGAWPDNPVPLTEASVLRPLPECGFAVNKAEQERFAGQWAEEHPKVDIVTLRPTVSLAEEHVGWVVRSLRSAAHLNGESEVPVQFLHMDDLATAVELGVVGDLTGVYNVAPNGWISSGTALELVGRTHRFNMPEQLLRRVTTWWWKKGPTLSRTGVLPLGNGSTPISPGVLRYARFPWVVASDRLRAAGWTPQFTSEQAFISGHKSPPWGMLDSHRRQQIALLGAVAGGLGVVWGALAVGRRLFRR